MNQFDQTAYHNEAQLHEVLSHPLRLWIYQQMADGIPHSLEEFSAASGGEADEIAAHLDILVKVGLVKLEQCGEDVIYRIINGSFSGEAEQKEKIETLFHLFEYAAKLSALSPFRCNPETQEIIAPPHFNDCWPVHDGKAVPFSEYVLPEDREKVAKAFYDINVGGQDSVSLEFRSDFYGKLRYFRTIVNLDPIKKAPWVQGVIQDVTDFMTQHYKLHRTLELQNLIVNSVPLILFAKDASDDFRYVLANRNTEEVLGVPAGKMQGCTDRDFLPPDEWNETRRTDQMLAATDGEATLVEHYKDSHGATRIYKMLKKIHNGPSREKLLFGVGTDITEQMELLENQETVNQCFSEIMVGVNAASREVVLGYIGRRLKASRAFLVHFNMKIEDVELDSEYSVASSTLHDVLPMKFNREDRWYKAVLCGKPMMCPDVTDGELRKKLGSWSNVHEALGVKSAYTARIYANGKLWGVFTLYYEDIPHNLTESEKSFFETASALLNLMCERDLDLKQEASVLADLRKTVSQMELGAFLTQSSFFYLDSETRGVSGTKDLERLYPHRNGKALLAEEWVLPDDLPEVQRSLHTIYYEGAPQTTLAFRSMYFGSLRHFRVLLRRDTVNPKMFFGAIQDVTEVTEKAIRLRESQELCELSLSASHASFFVKDADDSFKYVMCNKAYAESLGCTINEIIGKTDADLFHDPEDVRTITEYGHKAMSSPEGTVAQGFLTSPIGEKRLIKTVLTPFVGATGRRMLVGSGMDITDIDDLVRNEKINGEILKEAVKESDLSVLIDHVFDTVMTSLQCDRVMLLTRSANGEFQLYREQCSENCSPVGDKIQQEIFSKFSGLHFVNLKSGRAVFIEDLSQIPEIEPYIKKYPDYQTRACAVCPIVTEGALNGVFIVLFNYKRRFREASKWLTHAIGNTIALLLYRERQQQAVKEAEKAKSSFLAMMSHEIRTPLNAIIGFSELLKDGGISNEEQMDYLASIANAGNALLALINDILDLAKLESGKMSFQSNQSDFAQIVREIMDIFRIKCAERKLELVSRIADDFPLVWIDHLRIRQILLNLIGNAVKFTDAGSICINATFTPQTEDTGILEFSVTDTGIGISEEDQKRLFQKFVQASGIRGTQTAKNGTGLGLALCRELAEHMNGEVSLRSSIGKGSCFSVKMQGIRYRQALPKGIANSMEESEHLPVLGPCSVLLVDDVPMNLKVMSKMLENCGVKVITAGNGSEALQKLNSIQVDCVMTDLWMPVMNGVELAEKIRSNPKLKDMKIAVITADTEGGNQFDMSVFNEVLTKPVTRRKLLDFIMRSAG